MRHLKRLLFLFLLFSAVAYSETENILYNFDTSKYKNWCKSREYFARGCYWLGDIVADVLRITFNLFSVDSAKVITAVMPPYLLTRMVDENVQSHFYDAACHRNVNQLPSCCSWFARHGVGIPMAVLSSMALFAQDPDLQLTGRMTAIGLPLVHMGKDTLKSLEFKCCLRPWHENFSREKRSCGGFPSGHIADMVFMTALFGIRHGPTWGIPLGIFTFFVGANFLACNRHYLSQLVAGVGLGFIFAIAASKVVDTKLSEHWLIGPAFDGDCVGARFVYNF